MICHIASSVNRGRTSSTCGVTGWSPHPDDSIRNLDPWSKEMGQPFKLSYLWPLPSFGISNYQLFKRSDHEVAMDEGHLSNHSLEPRSLLKKVSGPVQKVEQKNIFRNCLDTCIGFFGGSKKPAQKPSEEHRVSLPPQLDPLPFQEKARHAKSSSSPNNAPIEHQVSPPPPSQPPTVHRLAPGAPRLGKSGEPEPGNVRQWESQPDLRGAANGGIGFAVSKYSKPDGLPAGVDRDLPPLPKGHGVEDALAEAAATPLIPTDKRPLPPLPPQRNINRLGLTLGANGEKPPSPLNKAQEGNGSPLIRPSVEIVGGLPGRENLDHSTPSSGPPPQGNRFGSMSQISGAQGKPPLPRLDIPDIPRKPVPGTADIAIPAGGPSSSASSSSASQRPPLVRRPGLRPPYLTLDPNANAFRPSSQWSLSPESNIAPTPQHPPSQHSSAHQSARSSGIQTNDATHDTLHVQDSYFPPVPSNHEPGLDSHNNRSGPRPGTPRPPSSKSVPFTAVKWTSNGSSAQPSQQRTHMLQDSSPNSPLPTPAISVTNAPPNEDRKSQEVSPLHPLTPHTPQEGMLKVPQNVQGVPQNGLQGVPGQVFDKNDSGEASPGGWV
ncbi:hypothetical protein H0H93_010069 [Arthromyces matolae]|nr:hypothetical protein H0H93_010069 [Arthromyces matolae]